MTSTKEMYKFKYCKENSYGEENTENIIIHGDNRIALELLEDNYENKIKCIYIDPPYNNGETYNHYDDDQEHEKWINDIVSVLIKLEKLLSNDGSIWISIDDKEVHYLKVIADKVFGRKNFITTIIWQHRTTRENRNTFSNNHEYILVYAKNPQEFKNTRNLLPITEEVLKRYKNPDNDVRGPWQSVSAHVQSGHAVASQFYEVTAPNGKVHKLPKGRCWAYNKEKMEKEINNNNIWFGKNGNGVPRIKKFLSDRKDGITPETLWFGNEVGTTKCAKKHILSLFPKEKVFDTPKPEELIKRILEIASNEGDLILDSFLGSGTTAAVAHKMKRSYIGIERGNQVFDLVVPRLKQVINGEQKGISVLVNWQGGNGYKYFETIKID
ncbi:site-specific DNA-methyltransferase [Clostridium aestuarii]|uniref:Methyltransferase n=1 Tax=Clostridium aestuarii TaxID=338193 RepID=A0ABT4D273_9CLOT|nr:site-specific DNA-methyltransferase [Clostridium aestuarii]MCY6485331.1 site-specific DNA-methyltransferase [Clostridium aestuarii]